jgi:hypothetical protein
MSTGKLVTLGTVAAAAVWALVWFRGDLHRYVKMKMM